MVDVALLEPGAGVRRKGRKCVRVRVHMSVGERDGRCVGAAGDEILGIRL